MLVSLTRFIVAVHVYAIYIQKQRIEYLSNYSEVQGSDHLNLTGFLARHGNSFELDVFSP